MNKVEFYKNDYQENGTKTIMHWSGYFTDNHPCWPRLSDKARENYQNREKVYLEKKWCTEEEIREIIAFLVEQAKEHAKYIDSLADLEEDESWN